MTHRPTIADFQRVAREAGRKGGDFSGPILDEHVRLHGWEFREDDSYILAAWLEGKDQHADRTANPFKAAGMELCYTVLRRLPNGDTWMYPVERDLEFMWGSPEVATVEQDLGTLLASIKAGVESLARPDVETLRIEGGYPQIPPFPAHVRARRTEVQNTPISPPSGDSNDSNP